MIDVIYFDAAKAATLIGAERLAFAEFESKLKDSNALDLNQLAAGTESKPIHEKVKSASIVRASGWASIEDYDRYLVMANNSNAIIEFIGRCTMNALEQSPEYQKAQQELDTARQVLKKEVDRNKRSGHEARLKALETRFRNMVAEQTQMQGLPDWMVNGFTLFIESYLRGRVSFRVYPFESIPEMQVLGNLKRDCFVNSSVEHFIATYGTKPFAKLTLVGLVTSIPEPTGHPFNPMTQFQRLSEQKQDVKLEMGFRQFYNALEILESLIGFARYPNVIVHPLAIYRSI
ncbi:MAG TPA: hypothetical protein VEJ63_24615 [Planctomycetota bacterium]|nr:hypothetical protein [Planctomycetota bacterium]